MLIVFLRPKRVLPRDSDTPQLTHTDYGFNCSMQHSNLVAKNRCGENEPGLHGHISGTNPGIAADLSVTALHTQHQVLALPWPDLAVKQAHLLAFHFSVHTAKVQPQNTVYRNRLFKQGQGFI